MYYFLRSSVVAYSMYIHWVFETYSSNGYSKQWDITYYRSMYIRVLTVSMDEKNWEKNIRDIILFS